MTEPDEEAARLRKYRSYLTRRSKWEAIKSCLDHEQVGIVWLRGRMRSLGESPDVLDEKWEKRILGDKKLFRPSGQGFFELADDVELGPPPTWKGERPGQSFVRDAYNWIMSQVPLVEADFVRAGRSLLSEEWDLYARVIVQGLDGLRRKGTEEPLRKLFEFAWEQAAECDIELRPQVHAVALWLTVAMGDVDAYTRLRAYIAEEGPRPWDILGSEDGQGSPIYKPRVFAYRQSEDGSHEEVPSDLSPEGVLTIIRAQLVQRRIMKARR